VLTPSHSSLSLFPEIFARSLRLAGRIAVAIPPFTGAWVFAPCSRVYVLCESPNTSNPFPSHFFDAACTLTQHIPHPFFRPSVRQVGNDRLRNRATQSFPSTPDSCHPDFEISHLLQPLIQLAFAQIPTFPTPLRGLLFFHYSLITGRALRAILTGRYPRRQALTGIPYQTRFPRIQRTVPVFHAPKKQRGDYNSIGRKDSRFRELAVCCRVRQERNIGFCCGCNALARLRRHLGWR